MKNEIIADLSPFFELENSLDQGLSSIIKKFLRQYFLTHQDGIALGSLYNLVINEVEKPLLEILMETCSGNQKKVAKILGISRNTVRKKLILHNLSVE